MVRDPVVYVYGCVLMCVYIHVTVSNRNHYIRLHIIYTHVYLEMHIMYIYIYTYSYMYSIYIYISSHILDCLAAHLLRFPYTY